jgi:hypothetical protein
LAASPAQVAAVNHGRHYSLEEANASLDWVRDLIGRLREARERLTDEEARRALSDATPGNGGGAPGQVVSEGFLALREALSELQAAEVILRDLDRGLVDFPALRDGEEIYLCWVEGEDEIGWWHPPDTGYAGRQPL